jgi:DNA (cytosine-5)-methyltransferase 1
MNELEVFEGFAGYGGASFGLKRSGIPHEIVGYSEIHPKAIELYDLNHKGIRNFGDIKMINPNELPDFNFFTGGFPCQAFSSAGSNHGELDTRGTLFYEIIRICEIKQPEFILLENVKGLLSKRHKKTFTKIISELRRIGYNVKYELLNSKDFGIPQNRERVWIFATKKSIPKGWSLSPPIENSSSFFKDFLEEEVDEKYYKNEKQIDRVIELTKVNMDVPEPLCLDIYNKKIKYDKVCMTITEPHHNTMRVVEPKKEGKFRMRKVTEKEHFRLMGFKDGEIDLGEFSYSQLCRAAGNGWEINIVEKILKQIKLLIELNEFGAPMVPNQKSVQDFF